MGEGPLGFFHLRQAAKICPITQSGVQPFPAAPPAPAPSRWGGTGEWLCSALLSPSQSGQGRDSSGSVTAATLSPHPHQGQEGDSSCGCSYGLYMAGACCRKGAKSRGRGLGGGRVLITALLSRACVRLELDELLGHLIIVALRKDAEDGEAGVIHVDSAAQGQPAGTAGSLQDIAELQDSNAHCPVLPGEAVILHTHLQLVALGARLRPQRAVGAQGTGSVGKGGSHSQDPGFMSAPFMTATSPLPLKHFKAASLGLG